jgi:hypothetical protein
MLSSKVKSLPIELEGGRKPTYLTSAKSVLKSVLTSVKAVSIVPSGDDKTYVHKENTDVSWVGFHPLRVRHLIAV